MNVSKKEFDKVVTQKKELFINEIGTRKLTAEQQRIYNAFAFQRPKPYKFKIVDSYGNTIRFTLYTNKKTDGVQHILYKHYKGKVGNIKAMEIINFCEIIRNGIISRADKDSITYKWKQRGVNYTLILGLKPTNAESNILKSIYSDKKNFKDSLLPIFI